MRAFLATASLVLLVALAPAAQASFFFGKQDSIVRLASTTFPGPNGTHLYLAHRITMSAFLLPYHVESQGLVLGISGEANQYLPLPSEREIQALQASGALPTPLPQPRIGWLNYLIGYSLEIALVVFVGIPLLRKPPGRRG